MGILRMKQMFLSKPFDTLEPILIRCWTFDEINIFSEHKENIYLKATDLYRNPVSEYT